MPAPPSKVCEYIKEILADGQPTKRCDLVAHAQKLAKGNGFVLEPSKAIPTVKKALNQLMSTSQISQPRTGWYQIANVSATRVDSNESSSPMEKDEDEVGETLVVEREIGDGPESVYVYYHDNDRKLAEHEGTEIWECKIGFTTGNPDVRIIGQGALTCFPRPPKIGLLIRSNDARSLETILHGALTAAGRHVDNGGGSEWFNTSPDRIAKWFFSFQETLSILSPDARRPEL